MKGIKIEKKRQLNFVLKRFLDSLNFNTFIFSSKGEPLIMQNVNKSSVTKCTLIHSAIT